MTEQQLRQQVADKMTSWVGATKGSAKHAEILAIYNGFKPLARGYTMKTSDAYCAATVSAAWIACGIAQYTGTECGVEKFARLAQDKGIWVENDAYVPKLGDAIVYDWDDNGVGDNTGAGDHIGIVTKPGTTSFTVTEGNMTGGKVGTRTMAVNGRYIRGFITPKYADIAKALGTTQAAAAPAGTTTASTTTAKKVVAAEKFDRAIAGTYIVTPNIGVNVRYGPSTDYGIIKAISKGTKVSNYGYYSIRGGVKWYYVRVGVTVGFISSEYLQKA